MWIYTTYTWIGIILNANAGLWQGKTTVDGIEIEYGKKHWHEVIIAL